MDYEGFMQELAERTCSAITSADVNIMFLVLDSLKESVEEHGFGSVTELGNVLEQYPATEYEGVTICARPFFMGCFSDLATDLDIIVDSSISMERFQNLTRAVRGELGFTSRGRYSVRNGKEGNRYSVQETAENAAVYSVFHRETPSHEDFRKTLPELEERISALELDLGIIASS